MTVPSPSFSRAMLTLPHEDPLEHEQLRNDWINAYPNSSPIEQGYIEHAVTVLIEKRRIQRAADPASLVLITGRTPTEAVETQVPGRAGGSHEDLPGSGVTHVVVVKSHERAAAGSEGLFFYRGVANSTSRPAIARTAGSGTRADRKTGRTARAVTVIIGQTPNKPEKTQILGETGDKNRLATESTRAGVSRGWENLLGQRRSSSRPPWALGWVFWATITFRSASAFRQTTGCLSVGITVAS